MLTWTRSQPRSTKRSRDPHTLCHHFQVQKRCRCGHGCFATPPQTQVACGSLGIVIPRSVPVKMNPPDSSTDHSVTRLMSNPRQVASPLEGRVAMPDDAKERLRESLQSCPPTHAAPSRERAGRERRWHLPAPVSATGSPSHHRARLECRRRGLLGAVGFAGGRDGWANKNITQTQQRRVGGA